MKLRTTTYLYIILLSVCGFIIAGLANTSLNNAYKISNIWNQFNKTRSEKSIALNELRAELGYGGMIHNYKNYLLRDSQETKYTAITYLGSVQAKILRYKTFKLNPTEVAALKTLEETLVNYRLAINQIEKIRSKNKIFDPVNHDIRIDDTKALQALNLLNREKNTDLARKSDKYNIIYTIHKAIGYGGMIHNYKNYILRKNITYKNNAEFYYQQAKSAIEFYATFNLSETEKEAINIISTTLNHYNLNLDIIEKMHQSVSSIQHIDSTVKIDDTPALQAFTDLSHELYEESEQKANQLHKSLNSVIETGNFIVIVTTISITIIVILSYWLIYYKLSRRITILTKSMNQLAQYNLDIDLKWQNNNDEIGDMSRSLQVFRSNIILRIKAEDDLKNMNNELESRVIERTKELEENEQRLTMLLETAAESIITIDIKGHILSINQSAINMFGYLDDEIIGKNISELMPEPYKKEHDQFIEKYLSTNKSTVIGKERIIHAQRKNGEIFPIEITIAESNYNGKRSFTGFIRDLSERFQQEEKIRRTQKMDALGKLVGGIAHDFNNLLGCILGYSGLLQTQVKDNAKLEKYISAIHSSGERGAKLTRKLLDFSRHKPGQTQSKININQVILNEKEIIEKSLTSIIRIHIRLEPDIWECYLDQSDLIDALLNLSINAMHAMPHGGTLSITTQNIVLDKITSKEFDLDHEGEYILLKIEDTGIGMSEEILSQIFEPFFTTKHDQGTGLGLSQVYGFIKRSNGSIHANSSPGQGTIISMLFPRYKTETDETDQFSDDDSTESYFGTESILVIDDEILFCDLASEIIKPYGYNVITANSPVEALSILEKKSFDLVVSDVIMPEMDGFKLAAIIQDLYPDTSIQMISGYSSITHLTANEELIKSMIAKPYNHHTLMRGIRKILDQKMEEYSQLS
ncbi:MAG: PAS domain S-box protein [Gammaproteobacteria bacterium]|nr:PAS domain S-box protein [Gammaproteobacteria bacterium]